MPNVRLTIPVTPPGTMGTTKGGHIYVELPDQSASTTARMDGTTIMDGSFVMQSDWAPLDLGKFPYLATEQAWIVDFGTNLNPIPAHNLRVYVSSYSDDVDTPLVRAGLPGATPSVVVSLAGLGLPAKPASGSNVTHDLVTGISGSVSAAVSVSGKLKRPISCTVDLSGLSASVSPHWGYQLLGFVNGDINTAPVLASGVITDTAGGLIPAGPEGISVAHTFGPDEPTLATSITIYAVAGEIAGTGRSAGLTHLTPGAFNANNIVPGITASCVVSIGTTTGVTDPTAFVQALLSSVFGNVAGLFDVNALSIDNARIALLAVDTAKLAALAVDASKLAGSSVTSTKIANLAVGTAAIQTGAITTALIANLAVGTAQIQNLAVGDAQIANLSVSKLLAGTISVAVSLTAPTITVSGFGYTINLDSSNGFKVTGNSCTTTITNATDSGAGGPAGIKIDSGTWRTSVVPTGIFIIDSGGVSRGALSVVSSGTGLEMNNPSSGSAFHVSISSGSPSVRIDGSGNPAFNINGNVGYTGTLAAAISGGRNVIGGIIV